MENILNVPIQKDLAPALPNKKQRNSNLELYRIIVMLLIVAHHYVVNSGIIGEIYKNPIEGKSIFLFLYGAWGKTGINCFMLITGYFMCKSKITVQKFMKLFLEIEFYKITFYLIFLITGYESFSVMGLLKAVWPVWGAKSGFVSCFLIFYLTIPFLNALIHNINEKMHIRLVLLCIFVYTIMGTLPKFSVSMNYISWFIVLYFISSYFSIYPKPIFEKTALWGILTLITLIVSSASIIVCIYIGKHLDRNIAYYFVSDSNKIFALLLAVFSFLFFKNLKMKPNRFINTVAASAFGVLMIHANSAAMRDWLWVDFLRNTEFLDSKWLILHAVGSVAGIYVICTLIDILRIRLLEKPLFKLIFRK